jgi:hypothetical protein
MAESVNMNSKSVQRRIAIQQGDPPVEVPVLADAILKISKAAEDLVKSGLNRKAIIVLLMHKTHFGYGTIECVLDGLADLRKDYCR